jgi:hypothetical protein
MPPEHLNFFPLVREVIDEEIFAEAVGAGVEGAAFVYSQGQAKRLAILYFANRGVGEIIQSCVAYWKLSTTTCKCGPLIDTLAELTQELSIEPEMGPAHLGDSKNVLPVG